MQALRKYFLKACNFEQKYITVIALALAVIVACIFFMLDQKLVRYESFPEVAEVTFRKGNFCFLSFEEQEYSLYDKRIVVLHEGDDVGVRGHDSYNWRGKRDSSVG